MKQSEDQVEKKLSACKKVRKGDKVVVISGNSRGQSGTVLSSDGHRVIVQGLNIRKRHMKGQGDRKGSIISLEKPIHVSNVKVCTADSKPVKLKIRQNETGEKELFYVDGNSNAVLYRSLKKS